ncbi:MAG: gamma carbonic anhydrase family protein [Bacteroidetes bacterium]|jgi:carbonic anhydrase/acetyltransferase-like protein (isoleucine patch superfamily)|nr:gamma carbonic anhydrase family protein [Bacteroidota bacterium]
MIQAADLQKILSKGKEVFIADTARVFGNVILGNEVSIWYGAVARGDSDLITIGNGSNVQDTAVIHVDPGFPTTIGENCIIGHGAIVHGATLANNVLVGMRATILNGAHIGEFSIIGAGAVVPEGMQIPPYSLVLGIPAKVIKTISEEQKEKIIKNAESYVKLSKIYLENQ